MRTSHSTRYSPAFASWITRLPTGIPALFKCTAICAALLGISILTASAECLPGPAGLVGWWRADANPLDSVGTNHGTLVNVAGFAPGETGQAFNFSGNIGSVVIPASASLDVGTGTGFSIETWINPASIDLERPIVEWNSVTGGNPYPYGVHLWISVPIGYGDGPGCLYANIVDTAGSFHWLSSAGGLITTNRFQHVALTYDKTSGLAMLYLDGSQVASQNLGMFTPQTSYNLYLGNRPGGEAAAFSWVGQLDEVSLYNRTLTGTEILAIYNAGSAGKCAPSPPPTCTPGSPNLVGWWKAEADASDANGTNNGAALNDVRFTNGIVGQAFYFDGVDDRVLVPSSVALNFGPGVDFSVEAWIKPQVVATDFGVQSIVNKRLAPNFLAAVGWEFGLVDGHLMCQLADAPLTDLDFSTFIASGPDLRDGQFHHVALSIQRNNSSGGKLMVDGQVVLVFDPTSQPGDLSTTEPLRIGAHADAALNSHFTGAVDEVGVYNTALSQADVLAIYNAGSAGKCVVSNPPSSACVSPVAGLVSWWRAEGTGEDAAGGNHGTLAGDATFGPGRVGQGFLFDGGNDLITVGTAPDLQLQDFAIETWIRRTSTAQVSYGSYGNGVIFGYGEGGYGLYLDPNGVPALSKIGINETKPEASITDTIFHHLAVTKSGGTVIFYIDGVAYSAPAYDPGFTFSTDAAIGARGDNLDNSFLGSIDEVSVYNRALTAAEIQFLYAAGSNGKCANAFQPVAMPDSLSTGTNTPVSFNAAKLLVNDIEPRGLALSVASVSSNSALGGTVELIAGQIHYTPPPDFSGNDVFTYSITNVHGIAATSTVTATLGNGGQAPLNVTHGPVVEDGQFIVRFAGIPDLTYTIEAAPGVDGPWTKVTNITAPITDTGFGIGVFEFREPVGAFESRFYRTIYPAY